MTSPTFTVPPNRANGQTGHITDHNDFSGNWATLLTSGGQQYAATRRSQALIPWHAGLANRSTARCNIVCLGDSITAGQGAAVIGSEPGWDLCWRSRLRDLLRARYPTQGMFGGGRGYIGAKNTGVLSFTWPSTITGSPASGTTLGPTGEFIQLTAGQSVAWTLLGDSADILWTQAAGAGSFSWQVDSGSTTNVSTAGGSTVDGKITHISLGTPGTHTVTVAYATGANADISGIVEYYGDYTSGIQVHDCGHYGWTTGNWVTSMNGGSAANSGAAIAALAPSLVIITLGANDQFNGVTPATYQTNLQTIITDLKAQLTSPFPSFVIQMLPPRSGQSGYTYPWSQYVSAAYAVAAADTSGPSSNSIVTVMDWTLGPRLLGGDTDVYGVWAGDGVHPLNLGHQATADGLLTFLSWE